MSSKLVTFIIAGMLGRFASIPVLSSLERLYCTSATFSSYKKAMFVKECDSTAILREQRQAVALAKLQAWSSAQRAKARRKTPGQIEASL